MFLDSGYSFDNSLSFLFAASCCEENSSTISYLLSKKSKISSLDNDKNSCLQLAADFGDEDTLKVLLDHLYSKISAGESRKLINNKNAHGETLLDCLSDFTDDTKGKICHLAFPGEVIKEGKICGFCKDEPIGVLHFPCKHAVLCKSCWDGGILGKWCFKCKGEVICTIDLE